MKAYSKEELYDIEHNTRQISSDPYKLFVAFVLSSFSDVIEDGENLFDKYVPERIAKEIIDDCISDYTNAIETGLMIEIWNKPYSIRNKRIINTELLGKIFKLTIENETAKLEIGNIFDVSPSGHSAKEANDENMRYFQKIVMVADSTENGYDNLTDIEAAVYCWGLFHSKNIGLETGPYQYHRFYEKYNDCFGLDMLEVIDCLCDGLRFPYHYWSFSAEKIRRWNTKNKQKSVVDYISTEDANDFWYTKALTGNFIEK